MDVRRQVLSGQTTICPVCLAIPRKKHPNGQCKGRHGVRERPYNSLCLYPGCPYQYLICLEHKELNLAHPHNTVNKNTIHALVDKYPELAGIQNEDLGARNIQEVFLEPHSVTKVDNSQANTMTTPKMTHHDISMTSALPIPQDTPLANFDSGTAVNDKLPTFLSTNKPSTDTSITSTPPAAVVQDHQLLANARDDTESWTVVINIRKQKKRNKTLNGSEVDSMEDTTIYSDPNQSSLAVTDEDWVENYCHLRQRPPKKSRKSPYYSWNKLGLPPKHHPSLHFNPGGSPKYYSKIWDVDIVVLTRPGTPESGRG